MAWERGQLYLCVAWLAKLLAGETICPWSVWFRAHFGGYKQQAPDERLAAWIAAHTLGIASLSRELQTLGHQLWLEDQNAFKLKVAPRLVLAGQMDILALAPDGHLTIYDVKTGRPRPSDQVQVMLYLLCLSTAFPRHRDKPVRGCLIYTSSGERLSVSTDLLTTEFRSTVREFVNLVAADTPPRRVPSRRGCLRCDISVVDCDERLEPTTDMADDLPTLDWQMGDE